MAEKAQVILTSLKTYLSRQYRLLGITSNDLFTDEEREQLNKIGDISRALDEEGLDRAERKRLTEQKKEESDKLKKLFAAYPFDKPRVINPKAVCMRKNGEPAEYITLERLKDEKIIQEFECELSRKLDVETDGFCWQKLNLQWSDKHGELLHQAFVNGIEADIETPEGRKIVHFDYFTSSAGQLRTDRASFVERESMWRVWPELYAGLYPKDIDAHGGINLNKISAYLGLVTGASERWKLKDGSYFDSDRCIVVKDIESHVTCVMDHIDTEYNIDRGLHTEKVNQCDGVGYILPCACEASDPPVDNFMVRAPRPSVEGAL